MFNFNNIVLSNKIGHKLSILSDYGFKFADVTKHIGDGSKVLNWIIIGFILLLLFQNSIEKLNKFKLNYKTIFLSALTFIIGILHLTRASEFLYFNF